MSMVKKFIVTILLMPLVAFSVHAKTLRVAYDADPVSLDPYMQISAGMLQNSHLVFDPLVRFNKNMKLVGRLATKWRRINDRTMRFTLRKGVVFHTGNPFTAKDVAYTIARIKEQSADFKAMFSSIAAINIIDDYTIDIVTKYPYPLLLNIMTYVFPMDSKFYAGRDEIKKGENTFASTHASGTGPFVVSKRQQGVEVIYTAFKGYWDKKRGNVDKIILTPIAENGTRVAALLSGSVDFIAPVAPTDFALVKRSNKVKLFTMPSDRIIFFLVNEKRRIEFQDVRVRRAMVYAVNNVGIVRKIMNGFGTASSQLSPKQYQGYNPRLKIRYNIRLARKLMKDAGYENGFSVTMMAPNNRYVNDAKIAEAVSAMLGRIKIKVNLKTMPKAQYWTQLDNRAADIMMLGWSSDTRDSANYHEFLTMCKNTTTGVGAYNANNYCNRKLDALIIKANKELNVEKREKLLQRAEKIVYDDAVLIPLHFQNLAWGAKKNLRVKPILNSLNFPYFGNLIIK